MPDSDFSPLFANQYNGQSEGEGSRASSPASSFNNAQNKKDNAQTNYLSKEQRAEKELLERVPPHNILAEQSVLGGVLLEASLLNSLMDIVVPEDFYHPAHQIIYKAFVELYKLSKPINSKTILIYLQDNNQLEQIGGTPYLLSIAENVASEESAKHFAQHVRDRSMQRSLIHTCADIIGKSYNQATAVEDLLNDSEREIFAISERRSTKTFESIGTLTEQIFRIATERTDQNTSVTGIPTDYKDLDHLTAGLQPSDLIILAARPAMGKTAFALNLAMRTAVNHNTPVAIFSLEMSSLSLAERMLSLWAKVNLTRLKRGQLDDVDWANLHNAASQLDSAPIYIDDSAELTPLTLRAKCRRLKAKHGLKFVIVDYLQLMSSNRKDSRELEISDISRNLKVLAKELQIPVLALSQLNRKVEERSDKRPMLSDLRESGAIEQDADIIMFIHREDAYNKDKTKELTNIAEIIIGKHRNGPTGIVELAYQPQFTAFENLVRDFVTE